MEHNNTSNEPSLIQSEAVVMFEKKGRRSKGNLKIMLKYFQNMETAAALMEIDLSKVLGM